MSNKPEEQSSHLSSSDTQAQSQPTPSSEEVTDNTTGAQASTSTPQASAEQEGFIYPPPPSFYHNVEPDPAPPTPAPVLQPAAPTPAPTEGTANQQAPASAPVPQPAPHQAYMPPPVGPYPPQQFPYPPQPGYMGQPYFIPQPPRKQSRKWLWILLSVISGIILVSCIACVWAVSSVFVPVYTQATGAILDSSQVVSNYYEAIQNKNYTTAFSYLDTKGSLSSLSEEAFTKQAQAQDEKWGTVLRYTPGQPGTKLVGDRISEITFELDVSRTQQKSYKVLLTLKKVGDSWKITEYSAI